MAQIRSVLLFVVFLASIHEVLSATNPGDVASLQSLKNQWQNTPPNWDNSDDPCEWDGVTCQNATVVSLRFSDMGLVGKLTGDIGGLTNLVSLDMSFNPGLTGSLPPQIADLKKLDTLILAGCSLTGVIPTEVGNLTELVFLALNQNNLSGNIPASLGLLSKLYWLDLADNRLTGNLPVSSAISPGLDLLKNAKHFHFNNNDLSGLIPAALFGSDMILVHAQFSRNQFTGNVPYTLGLVRTLEVLNLANNKLTGPIPDLSDLISLNFVDLSNNSFVPSEAPAWFSTLKSLTTLSVEHGSLQGPVPRNLFILQSLQYVNLVNNMFNGTLDISGSSNQLQLVDMENNNISGIALSSLGSTTIMLSGNPVCNSVLNSTKFCRH